LKRIFTGASGLNTVDDPARIKFDPETGVSDLQLATDINIESNGRVSRRQGFSLLQAGNFHSLFCNGGDCFVGKDGLLYQVKGDLSLLGVRSGLSGGRISFSDTGKRVNYTNSTQNGVIENSVSSAWSKKGFEHPDELEPYYAAPVGSLTWFCGGRAFVAVGDTVFYSEVTEPGLFKLGTRHFRLDSTVIMGAPVKSGAFVSTAKKTYFINTAGERPRCDQIANYPAVANSACHDLAEGLRLGLQSPGLCSFWLSKTGVCVGMPDGAMVNMTESKVSLTGHDAGSGATLLMGPYLLGSYQDCVTLCTSIERGPLTEKAATQYTNHNFNSYCRFGDYYLAASAAGLYKIGGDSDNGTAISASFAPVLTDFGDSHPKRLWYLYFGLEAELDLQVTVTTDEGCSATKILSPTKTTQSRRRIKVLSNLSGRYWTVKVENLLGGDFSIDTIDVEYVARSHGLVNG